MKYPIRHGNHSLEETSVVFFRQYLPADWNVNSIDRDYGQDMNIEIAEHGSYRGLEFIVQLKASQASNELNGNERQSLNVSTYNYLWDNLRVVLLVKYIESEKEAYYILLKDVPEPNQNQESLTVYLPRTNKLSQINWDEITEYVRLITYRKIEAGRPVRRLQNE
ncbi:DUF4365 domain-containing protein [Mucilaginibacter sp. ZT4R22]|uniref:DUF4365 domain-containing protein n=1 Tax=Mucilaginibacter pankratovii TaxID=2772110 RepID=A0ABR7WR97_9SPHI|nr:DUF4365 domain-containing protein [Mucilaginibacter pankratovii]MBD1364831.1 DUF4365 domain-containing protein [Mucilaginibacter pankratovii]